MAQIKADYEKRRERLLRRRPANPLADPDAPIDIDERLRGRRGERGMHQLPQVTGAFELEVRVEHGCLLANTAMLAILRRNKGARVADEQSEEQRQNRIISEIVELQREYYFENKNKVTERRRKPPRRDRARHAARAGLSMLLEEITLARLPLLPR